MLDVELKNVSKKYGKLTAVDKVSLGVESGTFQSLLGPSGSGKTTLLRIIAGFATPDEGEVYIRGTNVTKTPPHKREVGLVFQNYALFPHMTTHDNIAYSLRVKKLSREEIEKKVKSVLELVQMPGVEERYPKQLSGGQQQRVALARALVKEPNVLLLDEPLSNLDYKLREQMRVELKRIQREVGITAIFVTHDQEEAFSLSDRVILLNKGAIEQIGTPLEIYRSPSTHFVAGFVGTSNFFEGKISAIQGSTMTVSTNDGFKIQSRTESGLRTGQDVVVMVRGERISISDGSEPTLSNSFEAKVEFVSFLGSYIQFLCSANGKKIIVDRPATKELSIGANDRVKVEWDPDDCIVLNK